MADALPRAGELGTRPGDMLLITELLFVPKLDKALRSTGLTAPEASLIVDVLRGSVFPESISVENDPEHLSDEIAEAFEEGEENVVAKWGVDYDQLGEKKRGWSWLQAIAVREAAHRFWRLLATERGSFSANEILQRVGLIGMR